MKRSSHNVKELIITAASDIFARFGFRKTTIDEIASALHKGRSTIYHYFEGKEDIFQSVVEKESNVLKEEIIKAINKEDNPQEKLRVYILTRMHVFNRLVNFYSALKEDYLTHYAFIEKLREKHYQDEIKMIEKILREGINKGVFLVHENDVEIIAQAIIIALKGFEYPWLLNYNITNIEESLDKLLDTLFYGIAAH